MRYSAAGAARDIPLCLPNYQRLSMPDYLSLQSTAFARLERVACALDPDRATAQPARWTLTAQPRNRAACALRPEPPRL